MNSGTHMQGNINWPLKRTALCHLQQLELNMEQEIGSKLGKEYVKAVYCHSAYFTCMQSTS